MAYINQEIRFNAFFYSDDDTFDATPPTAASPDSVLFEILDELNSVIVSDDALVDGDNYYYIYAPESSGTYTFRFTASFTDSSDLVVEDDFNVEEESATPSFLESNYTITFATNFDPLYLDVDELTSYFPELTSIQIAEAIHIASQKVKSMFSLSDTGVPEDYMIEYIKAAAGCALSRLDDSYFGPNAYSNTGFTLGDFSIKDSTGSMAKANINTANAITWCELAFALEREMKYKSINPRPFVRGSSYPNPVAERRLNTRFGQRGTIKDTGRIDD